MADSPDPGAARDDLLALSEELLEQARELAAHWTELHRVLGEAAGAPVARARLSDAEPQAETDPRRLVALDLILAGHARDEVEAHLREEFGADAAAEVVAGIYGDDSSRA